MSEPDHPSTSLSSARKWAITISVMLITVTQMLDTSITNVALPHMQGSLSTSVEETSWVITSYLAANAIIIPATAWLTGFLRPAPPLPHLHHPLHGLSFLSGLAPNLEFLVAMRILQGLGGGPVVPMAQATMWEIFPLQAARPRHGGLGDGHHDGAHPRPHRRGWICDNWSWRWIFYVNLPIGVLGFLMASVFLFDSPYVKKPTSVDWPGAVLMVLGFGALQLMLDRGERADWFESSEITGLLLPSSPSWPSSTASSPRTSPSSTSVSSTIGTSRWAPW